MGTDHLNVAELKQNGVRVGFTPGVLTEAVAEMAIALLLATSRRLNEAYKIIHKYDSILHFINNFTILIEIFSTQVTNGNLSRGRQNFCADRASMDHL